MMRTLYWLLAMTLVTSGSPALAKPVPVPSPGQCPSDVGAAFAAACPCDADSNGQAWKNHGQYVSCVVRFRNGVRKQGCLDAQTQSTIARCAARSTCGKDGAVLCCVYDTSGTCNDPVLDGTPAGVCSNDETKACDASTDCITATGPRLSRRADTCTAHNGTVVGTGSVCSACPIPPPAPAPTPQ